MKASFSLTVCAGATLLALVATATDSRTAEPQAAVAPQAPSSAVGVLKEYHAATHLITVRIDQRTQTFTIGAKTSIRAGSTIIKPEQLARYLGAKVKVRYAETAAGRQAESVMLSTAAR